jgi:hypothetical protein
MSRLHLARTAILTRVAGFGKSVVPFFGLWTCEGLLGIWAQPVQCFWKNRNLFHDKSGARLSLTLQPVNWLR